MESCSFQSQLLAVVEVLAKAAVAEIDRRVDDSCTVLRLEVSHSRRDIELLKRKCEVMETELRRRKIRARRRVFHPPATDKFPPLDKTVMNKEGPSCDWDSQMESGTPSDPLQSADVEPAPASDHILIKEESAEEDTWRNDAEDKMSDFSGAEQLPDFPASPHDQGDSFAEHYHSAENPADPESLISPADAFGTFPEQQPNMSQNEAELVVKLETEDKPDENAAPLDSDEFMTEEDEAQMWMSGLCRDADGPSVSYAGPQFEQIPTVFASQSSLLLDNNAGSRVHSGPKSQSVLMSAARVKRRARTFACRRSQPEETLGALSQVNCTDPSSIHQHNAQRGAASHMSHPDEDLMAPVPTGHVYGHGRSTFGLARRMRTPWRSCLGEKRFGCSFCDKSFMRFSQLKEHLRSHTGEKPYSCAQCGRCFTKQCNLIRHAVVHSGEKPYECSLCGKCFTQRSSLKSHQKSAH
ncbi:unnamed protein product [Ophioblennius macclurei]